MEPPRSSQVAHGTKTSKVDVDLEENKNWKDIKPTQQLDALNKNLFKKRKYEEFREK